MVVWELEFEQIGAFYYYSTSDADNYGKHIMQMFNGWLWAMKIFTLRNVKVYWRHTWHLGVWITHNPHLPNGTSVQKVIFFFITCKFTGPVDGRFTFTCIFCSNVNIKIIINKKHTLSHRSLCFYFNPGTPMQASLACVSVMWTISKTHA